MAARARADGLHNSKDPPPAPPELIRAWRTSQYGLSRGAGWGNEPAGSLEKMTHCLNVYTAVKAFHAWGGSETDFANQYFDLWKIEIDVEHLERDMEQRRLNAG